MYRPGNLKSTSKEHESGYSEGDYEPSNSSLGVDVGRAVPIEEQGAYSQPPQQESSGGDQDELNSKVQELDLESEKSESKKKLETIETISNLRIKLAQSETKNAKQETQLKAAELDTLKLKFHYEAKLRQKDEETEETKSKPQPNSTIQEHEASATGNSFLDSLFAPNTKGTVDIRVKNRLGKSGTFGTVYEIEPVNSACIAAKVFHTNITNQPDFQQKLERETSILKLCKHDHVVKYYGTSIIPRLSATPVLLMERMDTDFEMYYSSTPAQLTLPGTINILVQVARGLDYLHSCDPKIIHRDLSARNVLLRIREGSRPLAKIADFGNSRSWDSTESMSQTEAAFFYYLAPEVSESRHYTVKIDVFSFGHLCLASSVQQVIKNLPGISWFDGSGHMYARSEVERREEYLGLLQQKIGANHPYITIVTNCLSNNKDHRPSAKELIERLTKISQTGMSCDCPNEGDGLSVNSSTSSDSKYACIN